MPERALGLMSGTSADGISLALIELPGPRGTLLRVTAQADYAYGPALQNRILGARSATPATLSELDFELGRLYARAALRFLKERRIASASLAAVGSHGQTVVHRPRGPRSSTLQIGEAAFLAEALGVPVVSDFRPRDMAAGGEGAPIVPFFDAALFGAGPPRILQNIGGIANASFAGRGVRAFGFDTGPGNCLIDLAVRRMTRGRRAFDRAGAIAARGKVDEAKLRRMLRQPFFLRRPPKSLDRGSFAEAYLERHFPSGRGRPEDAVAELTFFTALTIADACRRFAGRIRARELVVSGGGALNPVLMGQLRRLAAPLPVRSIAEFGIPPLAKEPAAIALMALEALRGRANHCYRATGARGPRILGKISPCLHSG